ncbi:hypothetical protein CH267_01950 [Rhodococcus sp. 06-621-2]|nr:hypothetical protein CH267_01950 [Rhodococcus sp. 06-621-2]
MTQPGWHPDPEGSGQLRWWDGQQWTSAVQPVPEAPKPPPAPVKTPSTPEQKRRNLIWGGVAAVVVASFVGYSAWNEARTDEPDTRAADTTTEAETSSAAPAEATTTQPQTRSTYVPPRITATSASPAPAPAAPSVGTPADPRCAPANEAIVAMVSAGLSDGTQSLTNGTVIDTGPYTYFGATTLDADGSFANRSDVWIIDGGAVYASTGGARNGSIWPKASSSIGISPGDESVAAVDNCVVQLTRGR